LNKITDLVVKASSLNICKDQH